MISNFYITLFIISLSLPISAEKVLMSMPDGVILSGNYHPVKDSKASVLMLHQCNRDQRMWSPLVDKLTANNIDVMTVDFRGYNDSASEQYNTRSDDSYLKSNNHIKSDSKSIYKKWRSITKHAVSRVLIGASCGGGQAAALAANNQEINALILFSPSLREYWFDTENWDKLHDRKSLPILGIASVGDQNALTAVERVLSKSEATYTEFLRYNGRHHGEPLFKHDPNLTQKMLVWIETVLSRNQ